METANQSLALNAELQKTVYRCFIVIFDAIIFFFLHFLKEPQFRPQNSYSSCSLGVCNNSVDVNRPHSAVHLEKLASV